MLFKDDLLAFYMLLSFSYVGISYLTAEISHVSYCIFFFVLSGHLTSIKCLKAGSEVVLLLTLFWISCKTLALIVIKCSFIYIFKLSFIIRYFLSLQTFKT